MGKVGEKQDGEGEEGLEEVEEGEDVGCWREAGV